MGTIELTVDNLSQLQFLPVLNLAHFQSSMNTTRQKIGVHLLRIGLAVVFLWFGFSQLFDSLTWVGIVPDWAVNLLHLPPAMIVMANGLLEVILGTLLALGIWVRFSSFVLAIHLLVISFDFGFSAIGIRDLGLSLATLALSLVYTRK
jgi:uncharacterized membrane protein YphA (DoxX/SURF4 family)